MSPISLQGHDRSARLQGESTHSVFHALSNGIRLALKGDKGEEGPRGFQGNLLHSRNVNLFHTMFRRNGRARFNGSQGRHWTHGSDWRTGLSARVSKEAVSAFILGHTRSSWHQRRHGNSRRKSAFERDHFAQIISFLCQGVIGVTGSKGVIGITGRSFDVCSRTFQVKLARPCSGPQGLQGDIGPQGKQGIQGFRVRRTHHECLSF